MEVLIQTDKRACSQSSERCETDSDVSTCNLELISQKFILYQTASCQCKQKTWTGIGLYELPIVISENAQNYDRETISRTESKRWRRRGTDQQI